METGSGGANVVIKVIGVGGAGGTFINNMIESGLENVEFIIVDTDVRNLWKCKADNKILIGESNTKGFGTNCNPQMGRLSAYVGRHEIIKAIKGADMVFVVAGFGGGTGTGATPVIADLAKNHGSLTITIPTMPFEFEGIIRNSQAEDGLKELREYTDALIVIPSQKFIDMKDKNTPFIHPFDMPDGMVCEAVRSIADLLTKTGYIMVDLNDVKTIMGNAGDFVIGTGVCGGDNRAERATEKAMSNSFAKEKLLENSKSILVNVSGGEDMGIHEVHEAMNYFHENLNPDANCIWGMIIDENLKDKIKVTFFASL